MDKPVYLDKILDKKLIVFILNFLKFFNIKFSWIKFGPIQNIDTGSVNQVITLNLETLKEIYY